MTIIATMDSEHFEWMAIGESEALAKQLIARAFRKHLNQAYGSSSEFPSQSWPRSNADLITELDNYYGIGIYEGGSGTAWRDDEILIGRTVKGSLTKRDIGS